MTRTLLCVGAATSLDRYVWAPQLRVGDVNRPSRVLELAGGKAFNVARAATGLGVRTRIVAQIGGHTGRAVRDLAERDRLAVEFVDGRGNTRQCLCLLDESTGVVTEMYEPVASGDGADDGRLVDAVGAALDKLAEGDFLALSGRLPSGRDPGLLARLVTLARTRDVTVVLDSEGEALRRALEAEPDIVKVNRDEALSALTGTGTVVDPQDLAQVIAERTSGTAVVTDGAAGAWAASFDGRHAHLAPPPITPAAPAGSGDSFVAGIVAGALARSAKTSPQDLLVDGMAASRVNVRRFIAGDIDVAAWEAERRELIGSR